jgi:hypothetical protein
VLEWFGSHFLPESAFLPGIRPFLAALLAFPLAAHAASRVFPVPVPAEMRSTAFTVAVNGIKVDVALAAASYEFVNFDITGPVDVAITAATPGFWASGLRGRDRPFAFGSLARPSSPFPGLGTF